MIKLKLLKILILIQLLIEKKLILKLHFKKKTVQSLKFYF